MSSGGVLSSIRYKAYGVAFIMVMALLAGLALAFYNKAFQPVINVTLKAQRSGLLLLPHSDVKVRGIVVGEVRELGSHGDGAKIQLALKPRYVDSIPSNVTARMVPKTIFGEKFVKLVEPDNPSGEHIHDGAVIPRDRSQVAVELNKVFNHLFSLLQTLEPQQLNSTLTAIATALDGRGEEIGKSLERVNAYLKQLNPHLPTIRHDITALADVVETYDKAAPDLLKTLENLVHTSRTIVEKRAELDALLRAATGASQTATGVLKENKQRFIQFNVTSKKPLALLARYSPEIPCVAKGLVRLEPRLEKVFGGRNPQANVTLEIVRPRPPYEQGVDAPKWGEHRGPRCYGLPDNPPVPMPGGELRDGTQDGGWPARPMPGAFTVTSRTSPGSAAEREVMNTFLGPALGMPPSEVPDVAGLLFGPMARGSVVKVK